MIAPLNHPLGLDNQLCFSLYGASIAMGRVYKPMLDELGITYPQYLVLHALWEQDARTIGAIAERLALESSTITPLVKRLAVAGLVTRERDPADERNVRVKLTDQGHALQQESACLAENVLARTGLTAAEIAVLTGQIQTLRRALAESSDNA
ncbi:MULTISPECIES: MarR family winged helix-turn-helix transcriptional regulator [unclassified Sphingomonas]|jgi:DNA-binding MarR family transcriptional regulator|uniref:MarR family winged helix-turn-helix transcriptional regulator n=1 Tax=unclassified Sphingomonas TaxID=196159 RepID=UPI0006FF9B9C|nr:MULTISPECIES: MarR family transcriptional regulator [unclassified Sphingomonas]KQN29543.1 MarR family transcriptional regulator [Sphingomonas sp. Leaf38]KQN31263.1 MarR family transcriptional regulator [Sphingomonas sp. Leaf34]